MRAFIVLLALVALAVVRPVRGAEYAIGADLSFLARAEERGTVFKDNGEARPALQIFKDHGYNWIRLRLFHTPTNLPNDLNLIRLDRVDDNVKATIIDKEALNTAKELDWEMR